MASTLAVLLLLCACLFTAPVGGYDCLGYFDRNGDYTPPKNCGWLEHCCGTCSNRYCCSNMFDWLSPYEQNFCSFHKGAAIGMGVMGFVIFVTVIIVIIVCCFWPRCYFYKKFRQHGCKVLNSSDTKQKLFSDVFEEDEHDTASNDGEPTQT
ncbi:shisa-5-like protein [Labeo rohita]|uniref:Shisa-5-like protein n=1 Tax=Labeo rohita TaxID=84645 RepID=A0A498P490_LABRO|nr:shisa-5-like protein [Labeo rohita]RXN38736.1 shisa-5-like protein [Labeo rohita]